MKKIPVGIIGATGMVGQRFMSLLKNHPWFEITCIAASAKSQGKRLGHLTVKNAITDMDTIVKSVSLVFCAVNMEKSAVIQLEAAYAKRGIPVISTNSANRWTSDVPMVIPEINPDHIRLIDIQRKRRGWKQGFIAVKPNCSIQSYVAVLTALASFVPIKVKVTSMQALSGAGKTVETWPQMVDTIIPFIDGEEKKSQREPMKIWGSIVGNKLILAKKPRISATCVRVPISDGHMASVAISFKKKPTKTQIIGALTHFKNPLSRLHLPSSGDQPFIQYFEDEDRPQIKLDRTYNHGMGICVGRLRKDTIFDWNFISLSHNTIRGAAGGAILIAELLVKKGYI